MIDLEDVFLVERLIARFANSFDVKDWDGLGRCLASSLHTDYSDLRGTPPETMPRERFVALRRSALEALHTHHLGGNVDVDLAGREGKASVSMVIHRRSAGGDVLNTHCIYQFRVVKAEGEWAIASIVQKVLWSDGKQAIHRGIVA